jgi:hypothetical protein
VKTVDWLIAQYKAAGLQPGGDKVGAVRGWTQDVPLQHSAFIAPPQVSVDGLARGCRGRRSRCARRRMAGTAMI